MAKGVNSNTSLRTTGARLISMPIAPTRKRSGVCKANPATSVSRGRLAIAVLALRSHESTGGKAASAARAPNRKVSEMLVVLSAPSARKAATPRPVRTPPATLPPMYIEYWVTNAFSEPRSPARRPRPPCTPTQNSPCPAPWTRAPRAVNAVEGGSTRVAAPAAIRQRPYATPVSGRRRASARRAPSAIAIVFSAISDPARNAVCACARTRSGRPIARLE